MTGRRRQIVLLAIIAALTCAGLTRKAVARFGSGRSHWRGDASRWYDDAQGAAMHAILFGACARFLWRTRRGAGQAAPDGPAARPGRWRGKPELRFVLLCVAGVQVLQLPLGALNVVLAVLEGPPPWDETLWTAFPTMALISPPIGVMIFLYDRRRLRREDRADAGACLTCGYDLRATPERCPECGTVPGRAGPSPTETTSR